TVAAQGQGHRPVLHRLPRRSRQCADRCDLSGTGRPVPRLPRACAADVPGRRPRPSPDGAAGRGPDRPGNRRSGGLLRRPAVPPDRPEPGQALERILVLLELGLPGDVRGRTGFRLLVLHVRIVDAACAAERLQQYHAVDLLAGARDGDADLADAAPDPLLEQRSAGQPVAVEAGRVVPDRWPLEPGALAVEVLDVRGHGSRRQAAPRLRCDAGRKPRSPGLVEQAGTGLAPRAIAVRDPPVIAGAAALPGPRRRGGFRAGTGVGAGRLATAGAGHCLATACGGIAFAARAGRGELRVPVRSVACLAGARIASRPGALRNG